MGRGRGRGRERERERERQKIYLTVIYMQPREFFSFRFRKLFYRQRPTKDLTGSFPISVNYDKLI